GGVLRCAGRDVDLLTRAVQGLAGHLSDNAPVAGQRGLPVIRGFQYDLDGLARLRTLRHLEARREGGGILDLHVSGIGIHVLPPPPADRDLVAVRVRYSGIERHRIARAGGDACFLYPDHGLVVGILVPRRDRPPHPRGEIVLRRRREVRLWGWRARRRLSGADLLDPLEEVVEG